MDIMQYNTARHIPKQSKQKKIKNEHNIYLLLDRGKKKREDNSSNPFAKALYLKNKEEIDRYEVQILTSGKMEKELQLKKFIERTIGSKGGFFYGKNDYKTKGIYRDSTFNILKNRTISRLQLNSKTFVNALILDIDTLFFGTKMWELEGLPEPSFIVENRVKKDIRELDDKEIKKTGIGKCHYVYLLEKPVRIGAEGGGYKVIAYYKAIQKAFTKKVNADPNYSNYITKNPLNPLIHKTTWHSAPKLKTFTLDELAEYVVLPQKGDIELTAQRADLLGRNVAIFDTVRHKAYKMIKDYARKSNFENAILALVEDYAYCTLGQYGKPIEYNEQKSIAKSIASFCWLNLKQKKSYKSHSFIDFLSEEGKEIANKRREKSIETRARKANEKLEKLKNYLICLQNGNNMNQHISIADISKRYKISQPKVKQLLIELGIEPQSRDIYLQKAYEKRKQAFDLRIKGLKYKEIAKEMDITLSHAKNLVIAYKRQDLEKVS